MEQDFSILDYGSEPVPQEPVEPAEPASPAEPVAETTGDDAGSQETDQSREDALLARLEAITAERLDLEKHVPVEHEAAPVTEVEQLPDFLKDADIDEVLSNSENFNKVLLAVYQRGLEDARKRVAEEVTQSLQAHIAGTVRHQLSMNELVKDFYDANPDLKPVRRTVAAIANEIARSDPNLTTQKVFEKTAEQTRKVLKMPSKPAGKTPSKGGFVNQRSRKVNAEPELSGVEREIMELLEL